MHAWADAFLCECIDPETGETVEDGEPGELVWTNLVFRRHELHPLPESRPVRADLG